VRGRMRVNGNSMLIGEYAIPVPAWDIMRDQQTFPMNSFKFLTDGQGQLIEQRIDYSFASAIRFHYPQSWVVQKQENAQANRLLVQLANPATAGTQMGLMNVTVLSTASLSNPLDQTSYAVDVPAEVAALRGRYAAMGYTLEPAREQTKLALTLKTDLAMREVYDMRPRLSEYETFRKADVTHELWVAFMRTTETPQKTILVELMTPSRDKDFYLWAVNTRAFDILLQSLR